MIDHLITFSIRHRTVVILAAVALALAGVYAVYQTPVDAIPDLSENQVIVFTEWPGHSPREIEDQVTYPLSLHLQGLAGIRSVRSSSDVNFSMISVIFEDGLSLTAARQQVAQRLARAGRTLPPGVTPQLGPDAAATGQIFWYTVEGAGFDLGRLRALQDWYVRPQLNAVPGVAEVASVGGYQIEYHVEVDPLRLQAFGVRLDDLLHAVARSNAAVGGHAIHKGNAEYIVRSVGWLGAAPGTADGDPDPQRILRDLENVPLTAADGQARRLADVARVTLGAGPRRGALEKDGNEVTGGVVLMRQGENPLDVTRRLQQKIQELQAGLPSGVRLVPFYDRTALIEGAVRTVTGTLLEAILTATVCVVLVLVHLRTSFIIALTLPLAVLASFVLMLLLRRLGVADIQTNIMSLAGIAISIGVLVDSSIVMAENAMHHLKGHFGDQPVRGDVRELVLPACRTVGRPIFFSVVIMLLSFLPVFALGGLEGKMFHPLAFTKSFALLAVGVLAVTLVPALCTVFIRGRLRGDMDSWVVRGVVQVYRPVLRYFLDRPAALVWFVGVTFVVGLAPVGDRRLFLPALGLALAACLLVARTAWARLAAGGSLVLLALVAEQNMKPLGREFMTPLDEGMVMDMPITVPRASITQGADDLKARDMIFCRFPEVLMVVGKVGRAETPTDPAPLDMIETMLEFRPVDLWPKRSLRVADAERQARTVLDALQAHGWVAPVADADERAGVVNEAVMAVLPLFDAQMREYAYQRNKEFERELGPALIRFTVEKLAALLEENGSLSRRLTASDLVLLGGASAPEHPEHLAMAPTLGDVTRIAQHTAHLLTRLGLVEADRDLFQYRPNPLVRGILLMHTTLGGSPPGFFTGLHDSVLVEHRRRWGEHLSHLNGELLARSPAACTHLMLVELLSRMHVPSPELAGLVRDLQRWRSDPPVLATRAAGHQHGAPAAPPPVELPPELHALQAEQAQRFGRWLLLWPRDRAELIGFGGELDRVMQMPGWVNVWTMPIQNRVDMLATGVNTTIGVRVLGRRLDDVVRASEAIASVLKRLPGAADVVADPIRGKGYLEVHPDREAAVRFGLSVGDLNDLVETAVGGKVVGTTVEGRRRHAVRVSYPRAWREDEESVQSLLVAVRGGESSTGLTHVPLADVADVRIVEGPATIKSENGLLRNYVRLNVRGRDAAEFVEEARSVVAAQVALPPGVYLDWTGQFEHEARARRTLLLVVPLVIGLIFLTLYWTYHDAADAMLMLLAVPGAVAGGVFFQWLFGYKFSVTVWVGYIACFGMATSTGIIMLVYLREALGRAGGLANLTLDQLRQAVLDGAAQRLRPKLLTEGTTILGLAPLLWATGTGSEVLKPMVVPVLGGLLMADEVIDLFLPVLFYWVRRRRWQRLHADSSSSGMLRHS